MHRDDDAAWRAIVDNYGDRPQLDDADHGPDARPRGPAEDVLDGDPAPTGGTEEGPATSDRDPGSFPGGPREAGAAWDQQSPDSDWTTDRFVPPPPPPVPTTTPDRYVAWAGVLGSPAVLLVSLIVGITLPGLLAYVLVAGFIGGFLYLVGRMPRGPRDPGDDGARL